MRAAATEETSEPGGRKIVDIYGQGLGAERVDLFTGTLHLDYTDVHLPGKYGLDLEIRRWYVSKYDSRMWGTSPTCQNLDYAGFGYNEVGEVLGYGWRFHMGRYYQQTQPWNGFGEQPADVLELPGGKQVAFYPVQSGSAMLPSTYPPNIAAANYPTRLLSPDNWIAFIPSVSGIPLYVFSPDGKHYAFASSLVTTWTGRRMWNCTEISVGGDVATPSTRITIDYKPFNPYVSNPYPYISAVHDSYGRLVTFTYATDPTDTYDFFIDPLYRMDFPVAGGAGTQYYYYHKPSPNPASSPGYPKAAQASSPAWVSPYMNADPALPGLLQKTTGQWCFLLAKVVPPPGDLFATQYQYYRDYAAGSDGNGGNLLSNILLPNGTTTGYDYAFMNRGDYGGGGCGQTTCWQALVRRGAKGTVFAGSFTGGVQTRTWDYQYDFILAPSGRKKVDSVWRVMVYWPVTDPNPKCEVYYFNPWYGYANYSCSPDWDSISCLNGNCEENGT